MNLNNTPIVGSSGVNSGGGNDNFDEDIAKLAGFTASECKSHSKSPVLQALYAEAREGSEWNEQRCFSDNDNKPIDWIIQDRRSEHFASFGNKYFKDKMDGPKISSLEWGACLIPRMLTGTIYQISKVGCSSPLIIFNPVFYVSSFLGFIGTCIPISQEARQEQAIRTCLQGKEVKFNSSSEITGRLDTANLIQKVVYDKNKILFGGEVHEAERIITAGKPVPSKVGGSLVGRYPFAQGHFTRKISPQEKETLVAECGKLRDIEKECLKRMPSLKDKTWFQKFQSNLAEMENYKGPQPDSGRISNRDGVIRYISKRGRGGKS